MDFPINQIPDKQKTFAFAGIPILNRRKPYNPSRLLCFLLPDLRIAGNLPIHLLIDIRNQILQTHDTALTGLKRLPILAVHGSEHEMNHGGVFLYIAGLFGHPEYLDKMQLLAFCR